MSKLKRNLFLLVAVLLTAKAVYAAVVPIVDTQASSSYGATYSSSSSGSNNHTSTYSGVECGEKTASSPEGCNTLLGIDNAVATPCDGGKYTCSVPAQKAPSRAAGDEEDERCQQIDVATQYLNSGETCSKVYGPGAIPLTCEGISVCYCDNDQYQFCPKNTMPVGDWCKTSHSATDKKYAECAPLPNCSDFSAAVHAELTNSEGACETKLGQGLLSETPCMEGKTKKYYCQWKSCGDITNATIASTEAEKNNATNQGGKEAGVCWNTTTATQNTIMVCGDDYTSNEAENTSCTNSKTPKVCDLEGTPKYHKTECGCSLELYPWTRDDCQRSKGMDYFVAGPTCDAGNNSIYYAYCLPKCNYSEKTQIVDFGDTCQSDDGITFSQGYWKCNAGSTTSNTYSCNVSDVTHCCDASSMTCYSQYIPKNSSSAYCYPQGNNFDTKNLCSDEDTMEAKWQCTCPVSYRTKEDCEKDNGLPSGNTCEFDGVVKYEKCDTKLPCPSEEDNTIVENENDCNGGRADKCIYNETTNELRYICKCPDGLKSLIEFCENKAGFTGNNNVKKSARLATCRANSNCASCLTSYNGTGTSSCAFEAKENNQTLKEFVKWKDFVLSCDKAKEERGDISIVTSKESCKLGNAEPKYEECVFSAETVTRYICVCPSEYKTIEEICSSKKDISLEECKANYIGVGSSCTYDTDENKQQVTKYKDLGYSCPKDVVLVNSPTDCVIDGTQTSATVCFDSAGEEKYRCGCPPSYGTTCEQTGYIRGGKSCEFESSTEIKYEKCLPQCDDASGLLVVDDVDACPSFDGAASRVGNACFKINDRNKEFYPCYCPLGEGYKTLEEYCGENGVTYQGYTFDKNECLSKFVGQGTVCTYDGGRKYKKFALMCPKNRPVYYSEESCSQNGINGVADYICYDPDEPDVEKVVCKCPSTWVDASGRDAKGTMICTDTQEASGQSCDLEGSQNLKYEKCYPLCDKLPTNGEGIHYLDDDKAFDRYCKTRLGEGATFGANGSGEQCSKSHALLYPCYCGEDYTKLCSNDDNQHPAENVAGCSVNDKIYYNKCDNNECLPESSTLAIIDLAESDTADGKCKTLYGSGATGRACGKNQAECTCDARTYAETCDYPLEEPTGATFCKYGDGSTLMKNGRNHYKIGECKVRPLLALCGKNILRQDGSSDTTPIIFVTETEGQCKSRYGSGAKAQLCEYEENTNKRAYNCYFSMSEFSYTEDTCPVRHVLSKEYVVYNGTKHYKSCDCHSAYKYHKYNCAGMLSGGACTQKVTTEMLKNDPTLADVNIPVGTDITRFPYCQCTADYSQVCDGERYIGVGTPCNGKYTSCECKKDEIPETWADNYYGCPGGKKPTGITKPDGCGGKYYQCSASDCTWEHTETCKSPLIGVDGCYDNQGNVGGYKSCRCPDGYKKCGDDSQGVGSPCILNGEYFYQSCEGIKSCVRGESQTCQQELLVGVNPCIRNEQTYFEYCTCAAGYDKLCENGEIGEGTACVLNGKKYYQSCSKPTSTCTSEHREICDTMQEAYDPCVNNDNKVMYKCKCPSNWTTCEDNGKADNASICTASNGTVYYDHCLISNSCTPVQEKTYKVCTDSQKGTGESCVSTEDSSTKYASCEETSACRGNGYQYTCLGFDQEALGSDVCIDENGNRLYKECKCPTSWVSCSGSNNKKGRVCIGVNENGTPKEPVYESCECDKDLFKYTCQKDGLNQGIIPPNSASCTPLTQSSGEEQATTFYMSCGCESSFKYSCSENGHVIDESQPYCQKTPGGEKLYEYCACSEQYNKSCNDTGAQKPEGAEGCTPKNPSAAGYDASTGTLYTSCTCGRAYKACNAPAVGVGTACEEDGVSLYKECSCASSGASQLCEAPKTGSGTSCTARSSSGVEITYFQQCVCGSSYYLSCSGGDYTTDKYDPSYKCENQYSKCKCNNSAYSTKLEIGQTPVDKNKCCYEHDPLSNDPDRQIGVWLCSSCGEAEEYEKVKAYFPNKSNTKEIDVTFKAAVAEKCGDENNYIAGKGSCTGNLYFTCAYDPSRY